MQTELLAFPLFWGGCRTAAAEEEEATTWPQGALFHALSTWSPHERLGYYLLSSRTSSQCSGESRSAAAGANDLERKNHNFYQRFFMKRPLRCCKTLINISHRFYPSNWEVMRWVKSSWSWFDEEYLAGGLWWKKPTQTLKTCKMQNWMDQSRVVQIKLLPRS